MADDDEEEVYGGLYENGHWHWDTVDNELIFISDLTPSTELLPLSIKAPTGTIEFRDDIDLIEQLRFRRRYQRKLLEGESDVITIQIADEMSSRMRELDTKVRTIQCEAIEDVYRTNLADLRVLVAKEYSIMSIGGDDMKKYHHMGPTKKRVSLSDKDTRQIETFLRISVQIVWLALGRRCFNQIELEVNRLFKTEIFNNVEHNLQTGYYSNMSNEEKGVLLGHCVRHDKKLFTKSPLVNAIFCDRPIDYRMIGLGVIKGIDSNPRLRYMKLATAGPEDEYDNYGVTVGILGRPRFSFDPMLRPLSVTSNKSVRSILHLNKSNLKTKDASGKSIPQVKLYPDIVLPSKEPIYFPNSFPDRPEIAKPCSEIQRKKWQKRLYRLTIANRSSFM